MTTSNSNARLTQVENGVVIKTLAPNVYLTYNPNGTPGVATFSCVDYMQVGNTYVQVGNDPKAVTIELPESLNICFGAVKDTMVDPVTGADLRKVSVAGILTIFQSAFDTAYNTRELQRQVSVAGEMSNTISFTYTANGNMLSFTSNTGSVNAVSWGWLLGDGTYSLESDPVHNYILSGDVDVSFVVKDVNGNTYFTKQTISV